MRENTFNRWCMLMQIIIVKFKLYLTEKCLKRKKITVSFPGKTPLKLNKRAKRPWIAHLSIQAKSQTFTFEIWATFDQGQRMTLTIDTHST